VNLPPRAVTAGPQIVDGPPAWTRLAICLLLSAIGSVGMWIVVVVLPTVQAEFGVDRAAASFPYTMTMVGFAIGGVVIGRFVDRLGVTAPLIGAALFLGVGFIVAAMTTAIWQFAIIQGVLIGVGAAATFGPLLADISHWFRRRRGIAVAIAASGNYLAGAIWPPLVEPLIQSDGWRAVYVGIGLFCVVTMIPLALLLRRRLPREDEANSAAGASPAGRLKSIDLSPRKLRMVLAVAGVGCCVAMSMPQVHIVALCNDLGYGVARGAQMLALMLAGGIVSRLVFGFLADYVGGVRTLITSSVLQCLALALYIPFDGLTSLYVVSLVFGLSQGGIVPSYTIIIREYLPAREAGQSVGIVIFATIVGMAFGGWISGWIFDATGSYQAAFVNGIAWNILNIGIMLLVLTRTRGRPRAVAA
jgi:MFS family permease